jgi:hypothetical protein
METQKPQREGKSRNVSEANPAVEWDPASFARRARRARARCSFSLARPRARFDAERSEDK